MKSFVIFDKQTLEVIVACFGDQFVLPVTMDVRTYDGVEPLLQTCEGGRMKIVPNGFVIPPGWLNEEDEDGQNDF